MDKAAYVFGTNMTMFFAYIIAKYPNTHIYTYSSVLVTVLLIHRYYTFWTNGWHMYLIDFCYMGNFVMLLYLNFFPKSQWLGMTAYLFSNGVLASGILAFRNSLVYHKIDFLTSLVTHSVPMVITFHIKWYTIPSQQHLPEEEQRFAPMPEITTWGDFGYYFFQVPLAVYFSWLFAYGIINFVCTSKVAGYTNDTVYRTFTTNPALLKKAKPLMQFIPLPVIFLASHFVYFFLFHLVGVLLYQSYWLNMIYCFLLLQWSVI